MRSIYRLLPGLIPETSFGLLHLHTLVNKSLSLKMLIPAALSIKMIRQASPASFCGPAKWTCSEISWICDIKTLYTSSSSSQGTSCSTSESGSSGFTLQKPGTWVSFSARHPWVSWTWGGWPRWPDVPFGRLRKISHAPWTYSLR